MLNTWKEIPIFHFKVIFYYGICLEHLSNTTKYAQPNVEYKFITLIFVCPCIINYVKLYR